MCLQVCICMYLYTFVCTKYYVEYIHMDMYFHILLLVDLLFSILACTYMYIVIVSMHVLSMYVCVHTHGHILVIVALLFNMHANMHVHVCVVVSMNVISAIIINLYLLLFSFSKNLCI